MMIQHFDLCDVALHDGAVTVRSADKSDEAILLRWFPEEDAVDRCELRVVDEFTIWPFIIMDGDAGAGFLQMWRTAAGVGGLEIFIAPEHRRQGIATRALALAAHYLRKHLGWEKITIEPHTDDDAAIACFEKAGFRDNGLRRDDGDHAHMILEWT